MVQAKTIGMMNGRWATLLKIALVGIPFLIALECWQTTNIFTLQTSVNEIVHLHEAIESNTDAIKVNSDAIMALPPPDWRERVKQLEGDMRLNVSDHTEIKIKLTEISQCLQNIKESLNGNHPQ